MKTILACVAVIAFLAAATAAGSVASAQHDPPKLTSMSQILASDLGKIDADNKLIVQEARPGAAGVGEPSCYNLQNNVDPEAAAIGNFLENDVTNDVAVLQNDINTLHSDVINFKRDIADFVNDGVPDPAGANQTVAAVNGKIATEMRRANSAIRQMQGLANAAYAKGNTLATGKCSSDGPGSPPTIPSVQP